MNSIQEKRRRKENRTGRFLVVVLSIVLVSVFGVRTVELHAKNRVYEAQIANLEAEYAQEEARSEELQEYEKYIQTKKFVEEYAKEKLGLIYPNEVVYKAQ